MNQIKILFAVALVLPLLNLGCTDPNKVITEPSLSLGGLDLVGTWKSNCHLDTNNGHYVIITTVIDVDSSFSTNGDLYDSSDTNCSGSIDSSYTVLGSVAVGAELSSGVFEFDTTITNMGPTFVGYNLITSPQADQFQIGAFDGTYDGTSPSARPVQINTAVTFVKQ